LAQNKEEVEQVGMVQREEEGERVMENKKKWGWKMKGNVNEVGEWRMLKMIA
jgi:hypothetical protein